MDQVTTRALGYLIPLAVSLVTLTAAYRSVTFAQTLSEPNVQKKVSRHPVVERPSPTARAKRCAIYGAGFYYIPGANACVRISGFVSVDGEVDSGR